MRMRRAVSREKRFESIQVVLERHLPRGRESARPHGHERLRTTKSMDESVGKARRARRIRGHEVTGLAGKPLAHAADVERSEERRVGKECRSRWSPYH